MHKVVTPPTVEPLTVDEVADHLRLGNSPSDADLIEALIVSAREWVEQYTQRALAEQTLEAILPAFPTDKSIKLRPPVHSITSVSYKDADGVTQTLESSPPDYVTALDMEPGELLPAIGDAWPTDTQATPDAVRVRYVAGYTTGGSPDDYPLPKTLRAAMLLVIGDLYENREASITGTIYTPTPVVDRLLFFYRLEMGT